MNFRKLAASLVCLLVIAVLLSCSNGFLPDTVISVTGVSLDKASVSLTVGATEQLGVTISPANATNESVTWSSSAETIATVSADGLVTAKAVGSATITVSSTDGAKTASCAVTVEAPVTPATDAYLTTLSVDVGGTPRDLLFVKTTMSYTVSVGTTIAEVTISATASSSNATIAGAGVLTLSAAGSSTVRSVVVTAADGTTTKTYNLTIKRAAEGASSVSSLSALSVTLLGVPKMLTPDPFDSGTLSYTVVGGFPNGTSVMKINATATDSGADITGDGDRTMVVGDNALAVIVTAADGVTMTTYTVNVERMNPESDKLSALSASGLSFAFSPNTRTYSLNAPNSLSATTIAATPELSGSTVDISLDGGTVFNPFTSGAVVALTEGLNTIKLRVNKEYSGAPGSSFYYTLYITRAASSASTNATLSALTLASGEVPVALSPAFTSGTYSYTATTPSNTSSLNVMATETDPGAVVAIVAGIDVLSYGANTVTVTVIAEDGTTQLSYTITVTRPNPPSISISSPSAGASIPVGTITVSGTYNDPEGEITNIGIFMTGMTSQGSASFSGGTFTVSVDASAMTNGTKNINIFAKDSHGGELCSTIIDITLTGGATGYTVSMSAGLSDEATTTSGYMSVALDNFVYSLDSPIDAMTFPYQILVEGVLNGQHKIDIYITDEPIMNNMGYKYLGGTATFDVIDADYDAGTIYLLRQ